MKARAEQVLVALERGIQHGERLGQRLLRLGDRLGLALVGRGHEHVDQDGEQGLLDLGHAPEAPLVAARLVLGARRPEAVLVEALGEIEVDRHQFEQLEVAVDQRRHLAVGIDLQILGRLQVLHLHAHVLERNVELVCDPERAGGARSGRSVDLYGHASSPKPFSRRARARRHIAVAMAEPFGHHRCEILVRPGDPAAGAHSIARRRGRRLGRLAAAQRPRRAHDELAELDDADVGRAEVLAGAVLDRALAVLDRGVLLAHAR